MNVELTPINQLVPFEKNPKIHSEDQINRIVRSIREFGWANPILALKENKMVIAGHARLKAARKMNLSEVPVIFLDMPYEKAIAYVMADNKLADMAEWDNKLLLPLLEEVKLAGLDVELTGFTAADISLMSKKEVQEDDFDAQAAADAIKEPITKPGDIWILKNHRLMCGDSTKKEDVEKLMDGKKANICFTSPPYNATENSLGGNKNMVKSKYLNSNDKITQGEWKELINNVLKNSCEFAEYSFFNIQSLASNKTALIEFVYDNRNHFVDTMIWYKGKGCPAMAKNVLNSRFEFIHIFSHEENPNRSIKTGNFHGTVSNVYEGTQQNNNEFSGIHAATFPIHLPAHFVSTFCQMNMIVVDWFGGCGTTLIACEQLDRICFSMELDPIYTDVCVQRWEKFTGQKAHKLEATIK